MARIRLDGRSLTRAQVCAAARGETQLELDEAQLAKVQAAADFLASQVARQEPIYGVTTG
ncbi:MAG: aromatic amino acid lyase, partial [Xanthomonadales bacterium]|nr:aromatic amino acid lyase [Xanthomonadales bacterium]